MQPGPWVDDTYAVSGRVELVLRWTAGSTGSIASIDANHRYGFVTPANPTPIVRNSAGNYTITFAETPAEVIDVWGQNLQASYSGTAGVVNMNWTAKAITGGSKTVTVQFTNAAGTATDPASGDILTVSAVVQTYVLK